MNKKTPGLVKFVFDYPFDLGISSDFYYPVTLFPQKDVALVKIFAKEGTQSFDKRYIQKEKVGESPFLEKLQFSDKNTSVKVVLENGGVMQTVAGEGGYVIYPWFFSEVEVIFSVDDIFILSNDHTGNDTVNRMYSFFNKFLSAYRQISGDTINRSLSINDDFSLYTLCYISEFSETEKNNPAENLFKLQKEQREFAPYPMRGSESQKDDIPFFRGRYASVSKTDIKKPTINIEKYESFYKCLSGFDIAPYRRMLLSGLERISLSADYQAAIVDFDTAVDMTASFYLRKYIKDSGKSDQEIKDLFDESIEESRKSGYTTTNKRISGLVEYLYAKGLISDKKDFLESEQRKKWRDIARKRRNDVVHEGKIFDRKEVKESFNISQKFIIFIENLCNQKNT